MLLIFMKNDYFKTFAKICKEEAIETYNTAIYKSNWFLLNSAKIINLCYILEIKAV